MRIFSVWFLKNCAMTCTEQGVFTVEEKNNVMARLFRNSLKHVLTFLYCNFLFHISLTYTPTPICCICDKVIAASLSAQKIYWSRSNVSVTFL